MLRLQKSTRQTSDASTRKKVARKARGFEAELCGSSRGKRKPDCRASHPWCHGPGRRDLSVSRQQGAAGHSCLDTKDEKPAPHTLWHLSVVQVLGQGTWLEVRGFALGQGLYLTGTLEKFKGASLTFKLLTGLLGGIVCFACFILIQASKVQDQSLWVNRSTQRPANHSAHTQQQQALTPRAP